MANVATQPGTWALKDQPQAHQRSVWGMAAQRFLRNRTATVGLIFLVLIVLMAIVPGVFARYERDEAHFEDAWQMPSAQYWFGTDALGRDV